MVRLILIHPRIMRDGASGRTAIAMLDLHIEPVADLRQHASGQNTFEARCVLDVRKRDPGFELVERILSEPYRKNYDEFENPLGWPRQFDTSRWVLIAAFLHVERVGGLIVAAHTPGLDMLENRADLAVLWDLRVAPAHRRQSVATSLLLAAQDWARGCGCTELKVETQNTNPGACRFYRTNGFRLSNVTQGAYRDLPDEVQLIWRKKA